MEVIIITGMSGAGRSRAADWFEDQGYYCVDKILRRASVASIEQNRYAVQSRGIVQMRND